MLDVKASMFSDVYYISASVYLAILCLYNNSKCRYCELRILVFVCQRDLPKDVHSPILSLTS